MNWYKIIKTDILKLSQVLDEDGVEIYDGFEAGKDYQHIGHYKTEQDSVMWVWDGYTIHQKDVNGGYQKGSWENHQNVFRHLLHGGNGLYKGRYERDSGNLSIVKPYRQRLYEIPGSLLTLLKQTFNPTRIYVYE
jgi:hypothetical protein